MRSLLSIIIGFFCITAFSCQNEFILIDTNHSIKNLQWSYANSVKIPIQIEDEKSAYTLYLNIRHTANYPYSNLFIIIHQINPNGEKKTSRHECKLALVDGRWLGKGSGSLYTHQIIFKKDYHFPQKGQYIFEIEQNMRDNPLKEISDIGIRIEKTST